MIGHHDWAKTLKLVSNPQWQELLESMQPYINNDQTVNDTADVNSPLVTPYMTTSSGFDPAGFKYFNHLVFHAPTQTTTGLDHDLDQLILKQIAIRLNGGKSFEIHEMGMPIHALSFNDWGKWITDYLGLTIELTPYSLLNEDDNIPCLCAMCSYVFWGEDMSPGELQRYMKQLQDPPISGVPNLVNLFTTHLPGYVFNGRLRSPSGQLLELWEIYRIARVCKACANNIHVMNDMNRVHQYSLGVRV